MRLLASKVVIDATKVRGRKAAIGALVRADPYADECLGCHPDQLSRSDSYCVEADELEVVRPLARLDWTAMSEK